MAVSFSIVGYGVTRCTGFCAYCSAASTANYSLGSKQDVKYLEEIDDYTFNQQYKADWGKVLELLQHDPQVVNDKEKKHIHFDLWGADSSTNLKMLNDMITHLTDISKKLGYDSIDFNTSTGGIGLYRNEVADFHAKHNIKLQLSHDGLGQWIRTKDIDVLVYDNTKELIKKGLLSTINCTLNFYNNDMMQNYIYFSEYLRMLFPDVYDKNKVASKEESDIFSRMFIKLNHIYNGTPCASALNAEGYFNGKKYGQLKNKPIGNLNLINDRQRAEEYNIPGMAHVLDNYIHSYRILLTQLRQPTFLPFYNYIAGQLQRFNMMPDTDTFNSACRAYQRFRHDIGPEKGRRSFTFALDTLGNYTECNLIDSSYSTKNPGGVQPKYCSSCRFKNSSECNPCGSEDFPDHCEYNYVWNQFLEEVKAGIYIIPSRYNGVTGVQNEKRILRDTGCTREQQPGSSICDSSKNRSRVNKKTQEAIQSKDYI